MLKCAFRSENLAPRVEGGGLRSNIQMYPSPSKVEGGGLRSKIEGIQIEYTVSREKSFISVIFANKKKMSSYHH